MENHGYNGMMKTYSKAALDLAKQMNKELDFSEKSLEILEEMLEQYHQSIPRGLKKLFVKGPSKNTIAQISEVCGAYLGEVMMKHVGGEWRESKRYENVIAFCFTDGTEIYLSDKIYQRIMLNDKGNNITLYYQPIDNLRSSIKSALSAC